MVDIQSAMELAKLKLNNGLKELAIIAPTTREAVVAVAGQNMPKFMERPFLLEMGVPKDCIDKVILALPITGVSRSDLALDLRLEPCFQK